MLTNSSRAIELKNYLFNENNKSLDYKYFYFLLIDIKEKIDVNKVLSFFEELFLDVVFIEYDNIYFMFYFNQVEFEIENIISSLMDDLSSSIKVFSSPRIKRENKDYFFKLVRLYNTYLASKSRVYMSIGDLVSEIILNNISDLKIVKQIVLSDLLDDPQMEILIKSMIQNNLNVTQTANNIFMHRNTVIKKIEQIKNVTGLNMQKFIDADVMYWLIKQK